jgi:hypothetical protein
MLMLLAAFSRLATEISFKTVNGTKVSTTKRRKNHKNASMAKMLFMTQIREEMI